MSVYFQFQQLVACSPPPVPAPTVVPPTPFASSIWHACRWLLHLEECLLLPLFSCSWGFASIFQKHQYLLRLQEQRLAELSAASSKKSGTRKSSSGSSAGGSRHSRGCSDSTRGGEEGVKTEEEGSFQGTVTEGRHHPHHQEEVEEKLGREKSTSRGGRGDEGISPEVALQVEMSKRVWPQDVMHRCLAVLATHANQMAEKDDTGGDDVVSGGFDLSGGRGEVKVKKEEDAVWRRKTAGCITIEGGEGRGGGESPKIPTGDASYSEHQASTNVTTSEEEEEEARWMEKRLCLVGYLHHLEFSSSFSSSWLFLQRLPEHACLTVSFHEVPAFVRSFSSNHRRVSLGDTNPFTTAVARKADTLEVFA